MYITVVENPSSILVVASLLGHVSKVMLLIAEMAKRIPNFM